MIRRILVWLSGLLTLVVLLAALLLLPPSVISEPRFRAECKPPFNADCAARAVAIGHSWWRRKNEGRAAEWYKLSAEAGRASAAFHLGWLHDDAGVKTFWRIAQSEPTGTLTPQAAYALESKAQDAMDAEEEQAIYWYKRAVDLGFAPAMNNLAQVYLYRRPSTDESRTEAARLLQQAVAAHNPVAAWNLSILYEDGAGVPADAAMAAKLRHIEPKRAAPSDLANPTLERTTFYNNQLIPKMVFDIRIGAKQGAPVDLTVKVHPVDPTLRTRDEVREYMRHWRNPPPPPNR